MGFDTGRQLLKNYPTFPSRKNEDYSPITKHKLEQCTYDIDTKYILMTSWLILTSYNLTSGFDGFDIQKRNAYGCSKSDSYNRNNTRYKPASSINWPCFTQI